MSCLWTKNSRTVFFTNCKQVILVSFLWKVESMTTEIFNVGLFFHPHCLLIFKGLIMTLNECVLKTKRKETGASLVVQWVGVCPAGPETQVRSLIRKVPHAMGQRGLCESPSSATREAAQWEASTLERRDAPTAQLERARAKPGGPLQPEPKYMCLKKRKKWERNMEKEKREIR